MKKLMIALTAVAMAAVAQAACVDWCYTDNTENGDYLGATVYAIAGTPASSFATLAAVQAAAMTGSAEIEDNIIFYCTADTTSAAAALTKSSGYYFVIVSADDKKYGISAAGDNSYVYDPDALEASPGVLQISSDGFIPTTPFETPGPEPTPEPTSAMLMLLGMAGLALKRKRA